MNIKKSLLVIALSVSSTIVVANPFLGWQDPSEEGDIPVGAQIMIWAWVIGWVIFLWKKVTHSRVSLGCSVEWVR